MRSSLSVNCEMRTFSLSETRVSDMCSRPDAISCALSGRKLSNASRRFLTSAKLGLRGPRARDLACSARFRVNVVHSPAMHSEHRRCHHIVLVLVHEPRDFLYLDRILVQIIPQYSTIIIEVFSGRTRYVPF